MVKSSHDFTILSLLIDSSPLSDEGHFETRNGHQDGNRNRDWSVFLFKRAV